MDGARFAEVGSKIADLGAQLQGLRTERDKLNAEIEKLETELRPLVLEHTKLLSELVGLPASPPPAAPLSEAPVAGPGFAPTTPKEKDGLRQRIIKFLERSEEGVGPHDVADALKLDPALVRQIMIEMAHGKPG